MPDIDACLAQYGLSLPPVPALDGAAPAAEPAQPSDETAPAGEAAPTEGAQPGEAAPAEGAQPGDNQPAPVETTTPDGQPAELVEDLPEGVSAEQIAPVLDSAKDVEGGAAPAADANVEATTDANADVQAAPAEPAAPPPQDDAAAQSSLEVPVETAAFSAVAEDGEQVDAAAVEPTVPQNVTIINQTNITNNQTNITNNVSTGDNSNVAIGQQTNQGSETVQGAVTEQSAAGSEQQGDRLVGRAEPITQFILQVGTQLVINSVGQDTSRFYDPQEDEIYYERLGNGRVRETITRPDGSQVVTVRNSQGDILRRSRITPDGREIVLNWVDDRYYDNVADWVDPAANLPPLRLNIPVREYVLDAEYADVNEVARFFAQPPVENVNRLYSIDEVKRSARVRDTVRRLEVGNLTFDTGSANISRDQVANLSTVANAMLNLLKQNPAETFLIEGHTDAVGSDISNLKLSDLRAATVARILTDFYNVPPENLATQGYGERYLKIRTEDAERENRRVTIRRITPLVTVANR
ncbi:OmpA family protein [Devosia sp. PTR5]|uniref:OmpA family protein n=1 Tax=Devosia oryzisoli TaxID=2774138 RepID=A0A927FSV1_9HYPH|nr:OmpA family protein [Devosia oryzisoli]